MFRPSGIEQCVYEDVAVDVKRGPGLWGGQFVIFVSTGIIGPQFLDNLIQFFTWSNEERVMMIILYLMEALYHTSDAVGQVWGAEKDGGQYPVAVSSLREHPGSDDRGLYERTRVFILTALLYMCYLV